MVWYRTIVMIDIFVKGVNQRQASAGKKSCCCKYAVW